MERASDVNAVTNFKKTPLHLAASYGHVHILVKLLENGAGMNLQDDDGSTALHWAAKKNQQGAVSALLSRATEDLVNLKDARGRTALHLAVRMEFESIIRALLDNGARVDIKDDVRTSCRTFPHRLKMAFRRKDKLRLTVRLQNKRLCSKRSLPVGRSGFRLQTVRRTITLAKPPTSLATVPERLSEPPPCKPCLKLNRAKKRRSVP